MIITHEIEMRQIATIRQKFLFFLLFTFDLLTLTGLKYLSIRRTKHLKLLK